MSTISHLRALSRWEENLGVLCLETLDKNVLFLFGLARPKEDANKHFLGDEQ